MYKEFNGCFKINADTNGLKSIKSITVGFWMSILIILLMTFCMTVNWAHVRWTIKNAVYLQTFGPATAPAPTPTPCSFWKILQNRKIVCWCSPKGWRPLLWGILGTPLSGLPSQSVEENEENLVEKRNFLLISLLISKRQGDLG